MCIKNYPWTTCINLFFVIWLTYTSCSNEDHALHGNYLIKNKQKLDSIVQHIPNNIKHLFFISPSSKCLFCDKKIFELTDNKNTMVVTTYDKIYLFFQNKKLHNVEKISETEYTQLFSNNYLNFSKYIQIHNRKIIWIQNITPQYIDTLLSHIHLQ